MKKPDFSGIACVLTLLLSACGDADSESIAALPRAGAAEPAVDDAADSSAAPASAATDSMQGEGSAEALDADLALDPESVDEADASRPAELRWRSCGQFDGRNLECAELDVPIDYEQLEGEKLPIALRRIKANPLEPYHGILLFNPGGPGGAGIDSALALFEFGLFDVIAPGYDIIGFDPRGVANSGEVGCGIEPENLYPGAAPTAPQEGSLEEYVASYRASGERCEREWGPLFRKLGSNNVVRDMEEIRKALDAPRLNFLGASYGTRLGALYAHRYPETAGRIVLDAPVHPQPSMVRSMRGVFYEVVELHQRVLSGCETGEFTCLPDAPSLFEQALDNARQRGLGELFTYQWMLLLSSRSTVEQVLLAWLAAEAADPGSEWIVSALQGDRPRIVADANGVAYASVNCTDDNFEPPTLAELESLRAEFEQVDPVFAESLVLSAAACTAWPATRDPVPLPIALDAPPLLVIGGTADSRTPYELSVAMTEALGNATLLTSNHYGHGAIIEAGECVWYTIRAYLATGSLPATGAVCD